MRKPAAGNKKATFRSLFYASTSLKPKNNNGVTADDKARKPMLFATELTGVKLSISSYAKASFNAELSRPSSHY